MSRSDELYFGNLPHDIRESEIEDFFRGFGRIRDIKIKKGFSFVQFNDYRDAEDAKYKLDGTRFCGARVTVDFAKGGGRDGRSGRPRDDDDRRRGGSSGFGGFRGGDRDRSFGGNDRRDRRGPGYDNQDRYGGGRDGGRRGGGRRDMRTRFALLVSNLDDRVTWMDLKDTARKYGAVTFADANKLKTGEGIVSFESKEDCEKAMDRMNGVELMGLPMRLEFEYPDEFGGGRRSRSRSPRRSNSPRRSRSRSPLERERNGDRSRSRSRDNNEEQDEERERSRSPPAKRSRSASPRDQDGGDSRDGGSREASPAQED